MCKSVLITHSGATALQKYLGFMRASIALVISLAGYENGLTNMTDRSIRDICRVFYVNEDWLRTGEGNMFRARNTTNEELALQIGKLLKTDDEFTKNLFLEYLKLPPEMKTLFEDFVHNLAKSK